jgi:heme-degrading monooxygenase HmoA
MYARVAAFENRDMTGADELTAKVKERRDVVPGAQGFLMLIDRDNGTALGITLFGTEQAIRDAEPAFEQMAETIPAEQRGRRVSVDAYEVLMLEGGTGAKAARVSTISGPPEQIDAGTRQAIEDVLPRAREMDGFVGVISLGDRATGTTKLVTLWSSADALTASAEKANALRREAADSAGGTIASVEPFEVAIAEIPAGVTTS